MAIKTKEQSYALTVSFKDGTHTVIQPLPEDLVEWVYKQLTFEMTVFRIRLPEPKRTYLINPTLAKCMAFEPI